MSKNNRRKGKICPVCNGKGKYHDKSQDMIVHCEKCNGKGWVRIFKPGDK